jgi:two-component system sensor histidine kinase AlgZ
MYAFQIQNIDKTRLMAFPRSFFDCLPRTLSKWGANKAAKNINAVVNNEGEPAQGLLPHLCSASAVFGLVLIGELIALALVLMDSSLSTFSWTQLGYVSMVVQWIVLLSALVLCGISIPLSRLSSRLSPLVGGAVAYLSVLLIALAVISGALWVVNAYIAWLDVIKYMVLTAIFSGILLRYLYLQQQLRLQQQAELQSRIQALHARIRPHFLFNSMNAVASLIPVNPILAEKVVEDLSEVFRMSLQQASLISLEREIELCRRYVDIEQVRLGERLLVEWQLPEHMGEIQVPSFILQPLIENAIYHGIQRLPDGGIVSVSLMIENQQLSLMVQNPMPVFNDNETDHLLSGHVGADKKSNQMALDNITHRLQAHYGDRATVETMVVDKGNSAPLYKVSLHLPVKQLV